MSETEEKGHSRWLLIKALLIRNFNPVLLDVFILLLRLAVLAFLLENHLPVSLLFLGWAAQTFTQSPWLTTAGVRYLSILPHSLSITISNTAIKL